MSATSASRDPLSQGFHSLSTPNVSDALDQLGLFGAPQGLLPLWPDGQRVVGRAATLRLVAREESDRSPVEGTLTAIGAAAPGEILLIDHAGSTDVNSFGGVSAFTAARRGLLGCVIDGVSRDVDEMRAIHFPVWAKGVVQTSVRGRCGYGGHGIEIRLGGVACRPGDIVVADANGVVVVPEGRASEVLELAHGFLAMEERIKDAIAAGTDPVQAHLEAGYEVPSAG